MILSKENLQHLHSDHVAVPSAASLNLPEKVLQFGTGVLLRGLPDYFINNANQQGVFNGRVAVVKSTPGKTADFDRQNALYTICLRGVENGQSVSKNIISSAVSRVLSADEQWDEILNIAESADLKLIVSNTTEVGITLVNEKINGAAPNSFPAKVLAVLYKRFKAFNGSKESGLIIVATELIPENGEKLAAIVLQLAHFNGLEAAFVAWLATANTFCNSLVDRIVPGKPDSSTLSKLQAELGYEDDLLIMAEPYSLWAIEGDEKVKEALSFATVDAGVVIAKDIEIYRELKVRLLNGTHTLTSGIAFLMGISTVKDAMQNADLKHYVQTLMNQEISPAIPYQVSEKQSSAFARTVVDRFSNPFIEHLWHNITFQYTMKMKIRILPMLKKHFTEQASVPHFMALGLAAYLRFMQAESFSDGKYYGSYQQQKYLIQDDSAAFFYQHSQKENAYTAENLLGDHEFWGFNFNEFPGFVSAVEENYQLIKNEGMETALMQLLTSQIQ